MVDLIQSKSKIRMQRIIEALESGEVRASDLGKDNVIKMLQLINDYTEQCADLDSQILVLSEDIKVKTIWSFSWASRLLTEKGGIIRRPRHSFELRSEDCEYEDHPHLPEYIRFGYNNKLLPIIELECENGEYTIEWAMDDDALYNGTEIEEYGLTIDDINANDWEHIIC